ncbi:CYFA0S04e00914g1_1 [Cyberlindnera fabianii]|uniref:Proteasome assembly chaperone 2 n=1 Tax=Cyberlindnera fabianii TaxID=36022 RepID=A0A061AQX3_CYBFA|nr:CYFA0S04e00914g1_1 [Cyberlindnera fabianii]
MAEFFPVSATASKSDILSQLEGSKLIVPSIAIGNVPQLSADLLLHNLGTKLIARLDSTLLYPFASPVDYVLDGSSKQTNEISTGLELYFNDSTKIAVIQQRSPILPGYAKNFLDYLVSFIEASKFTSVIVLDSNEAALREDINIDRPLELYSNNLTENFKSLKVTTSDSSDKLETSFTPFVSALVSELKRATDLTVYALVIYVYEGDNTYDAQVLAAETVGVLEVETPKEWKIPVSWSGAYGDRPLPSGLNEGIYG